MCWFEIDRKRSNSNTVAIRVSGYNTRMNTDIRAGLYAWGGPGTIRLLQTKYHTPTINHGSFLTMYDRDYLRAVQERLGVTDMWVTYSWGFAERTEHEDRQFIRERLENFYNAGIRTHGYVQGFNVVDRDFVGHDVFCVSPRGGKIPYSRGRSQTCPNNPRASELILSRVAQASQEAFDGVFIDNMVFGMPPSVVRADGATWFGCACAFCKKAFRLAYGYALPTGPVIGRDELGDYLQFRRRSIAGVIGKASKIVHSSRKAFGVNLYDPYIHTSDVFFGYHLDDISPYLDYYLFENHSLGNGTIDNDHLAPVIRSADVPVFIVSYRRGIGFDRSFTHQDMMRIATDARRLGYYPCFKGTEYKTNGVWHALDVTTLPRVVPAVMSMHTEPRQRHPASLRNRSYTDWLLMRITGTIGPAAMRMTFESRLAWNALVAIGIPQRLLRSKRHIDTTIWYNRLAQIHSTSEPKS